MRSIMALLTILMIFEIMLMSWEKDQTSRTEAISPTQQQPGSADTIIITIPDLKNIILASDKKENKKQPKPAQKSHTADSCAKQIHQAIQKYNSRFDPIFRKYSKQIFGPEFDWLWFKSQGICESRLQEKAQSPSKASGIMQILPSTYFDIIQKYGWLSENIFDPESNIAAGILYDYQLWKLLHSYQNIRQMEFHDRLKLMFGSYNAGYGNVLQAMQLCGSYNWDEILVVAPKVKTWRNWRDTKIYVNNIFSVYQELRISDGT